MVRLWPRGFVYWDPLTQGCKTLFFFLPRWCLLTYHFFFFIKIFVWCLFLAIIHFRPFNFFFLFFCRHVPLAWKWWMRVRKSWRTSTFFRFYKEFVKKSFLNIKKLFSCKKRKKKKSKRNILEKWELLYLHKF